MQLQCDIQCGGHVHFDGNADDVGWKFARLYFLLINGTKNNRHARKSVFAMLQGKIQTRGEAGDDKVDFTVRVFSFQKRGQVRLVI